MRYTVLAEAVQRGWQHPAPVGGWHRLATRGGSVAEQGGRGQGAALSRGGQGRRQARVTGAKGGAACLAVC